MRPRLHPALTRIWRDESTLQIGTTPEHAVVLSGLRPADVAIVNSLDGNVTRDHLREMAAKLNIHGADDRLLNELTEAGVIVDGDHVVTTDFADPDTASAALVNSRLTDIPRVMRKRRSTHVEIRGCGRVGAAITRLLDAAGVGHLEPRDARNTRPADVAPGGLATSDIGRPRETAAKEHIAKRRQARRSPSRPPDFVVLAPTCGEPADYADLMRTNTPHMLAHIVETTGIIGPLVVPGDTPCLRCLNLHRTDRDPGWPHLHHQLEHHAPEAPAIDSALAATVAGLAASSVVAHLDGHRAATLGGTIEIVLPGGLPRRRSWMQHPACGCSWVDT